MVLLAIGCAQCALAASPALQAGQPAPALVIRQFDGALLDLAALRGRVVVLNFWASWCGPCRSEMPALETLSREFRSQGVVVVGVSADDRHDRADALKAAQRFTYPIGLLTDAQVNGFGWPRALPLTYIVAADGTIAAAMYANHGALSVEELRSAVQSSLAAPLSAPPAQRAQRAPVGAAPDAALAPRR